MAGFSNGERCGYFLNYRFDRIVKCDNMCELIVL